MNYSSQSTQLKHRTSLKVLICNNDDVSGLVSYLGPGDVREVGALRWLLPVMLIRKYIDTCTECTANYFALIPGQGQDNLNWIDRVTIVQSDT